jgi:hypothetical protein
MSAAYELAMQNILSRIQGLSLTDLTSDRVHYEAVGTDEAKKLPLITIWPGQPEKIPAGEGTNATDRFHYSAYVAIVAGIGDETAMRPKMLLWREQIIDEFHLKTMPVTSIEFTEVVPKNVFDRGAWFGKKLMVSELEIIIHRLRVRT